MGVSVSDAKLRELERRWRETGAVEDEAAWLRERVRVGELTRERLFLAASCGHDGARVAAEGEAPPLLRNANDLGRLFDWGMDVPVRGAAAACELVRLSGVPAVEEAARRAIQAVRVWCDCPCDRHAQEAELSADVVAETADPSFEEALGGFSGTNAVTELAQVPGDVERMHAGQLARTKVTSFLVSHDGSETIVDHLIASGLAERAIVIEVCRALAEWALSSGGPTASAH